MLFLSNVKSANRGEIGREAICASQLGDALLFLERYNFIERVYVRGKGSHHSKDILNYKLIERGFANELTWE